MSFSLYSIFNLSAYGKTEPSFQIKPAQQLFGEPVSIKITCLKAEESVIIHAHSKDGSGTDWESEATFKANQAGVIDLEKQAPVSGDYTIADPLGLLWSMKPVNPKEAKMQPYNFEALDHMLIELTGETSKGKSFAGEIRRYYQMPSSELVRVPLEKEGFVGALFHSSKGGPYPCLLLLGSGGGPQEWWAKLMASHGFAALTLAYSNYKGLPREMVEIPLEYFKEAIGWLKAQKAVDGNRIAVLGGSKGGELSLLLAATFPEINAVVACVPSGLIWQGISLERIASTWSMNGKGLPFARWYFSAESAQQMQLGRSLSLLESYSLEKNDPAVLEKATIPVEKIKGPILLVSGTDDQMWPSTQFSNMVMKRLEMYNHPHERKHLSYEGAGHLVFLPYFITGGNREPLPFQFGGNPRADAQGSADFWAKMLDFLHRHLEK